MQNQMVIRFSPVTADTFARTPISRRHIGFHADDRPDACFFGFFLELPRRVQVTVIGDGQGRLLELEGPVDQVIYAVSAV